MSNSQQIVHSIQSTNLADILERVLDKGIVIAGDIQIKLADVELLTIKIRLLIASVDKAQQIGINWWEHDSYLSSSAKKDATEKENERLGRKNEELKKKVESLTAKRKTGAKA
ncbi:MAG: gas vesicle protein GvpJ [Candidatus Yanofskybacteria bacterium]|nr:gas vesicle protein GvpJ [Candidatus Yanofskybacteria bacterium]